jgi:hypothetical protein
VNTESAQKIDAHTECAQKKFDAHTECALQHPFKFTNFLFLADHALKKFYVHTDYALKN